MKSIGTLWVEPRVLTAKARELLDEKAVIASLLDRLLNEYVSTTDCFGLSATDIAVQQIVRIKQICDEIIYTLGYVSEYVNTLEEVAAYYRREPEIGQSSALEDILCRNTDVFR